MSALRRAAVRTGLALALASGVAGGAAAQFKIEPMGDWDRVSIEHLGFFVAAAPNTRAARSYCILDKLYDLPHVEALRSDPDVLKAGLAPDFACIRLDCRPQGHRHDAELTLVFNAPPLADKRRLEGGVSMAIRLASGEPPIVLFERAQRQLELSRDGNFELGLWQTGWPRASGERKHVQGLVLLTATNAFLDRIAANQKAEFVLQPWADMRAQQLAHDGRTVSFSLARMADVLGALRAHCAERGKRRN
jgi:hypothetical protein